MSGKSVARAVMGIWVIWHAVFGIFATFAPQLGARVTGWSPEGGWSADLLAMSTQYGMVMLLLAGLYAFVTFKPVRYRELIWVAVGEQVLGMLYALYVFYAVGTVTASQVLAQALINLSLVGLLLTVMVRLQGKTSGASGATPPLDNADGTAQAS